MAGSISTTPLYLFSTGRLLAATHFRGRFVCSASSTTDYRNRNRRGKVNCKVDAEKGQGSDEGYLEREIAAARREKRPYRIDKSLLTPAERQTLRLKSKAIPMVADSDPVDVVYEDETFLAVCKPSFVKMHPSHRFQGGSLLNRVIGYLGYAPWLLHRLDMHTTGVCVFAKRKDVCSPIMRQFEQGQVQKHYLCLVDDDRDARTFDINKEFVVDAPIQRHERIAFVREVGDTREDWKQAMTSFRMLSASTNPDPRMNIMLLHATPKTGRTHQIRVHARHAGLPIIGDDLYNPREHKMYEDFEEISRAAQDESLTKYADNNPLRKGLKLHAWKITLINPTSETPITFCASPPLHMTKLMESVGMKVALQ